MNSSIQVIVDGKVVLDGIGMVEDQGEGETEYLVVGKNGDEFIVQVPDAE